MVVGDEPQLRTGVARSHVGRHEAWEERERESNTTNKKDQQTLYNLLIYIDVVKFLLHVSHLSILLNCIILYCTDYVIFTAFTSMCNCFQTYRC